MKQSDKQRLAKIIDYGDKLAKYIETEHIGRNELLNDYTAQWTVTTPLYNIGEHVYQLSDGLKDSNTKIPWSMISGMRHRWTSILKMFRRNLLALLRTHPR